MKKILTVLLIAVLAAGMVFAANFSGSATLSAGYDFDTTQWGFVNGQTLDANFTYELGKENNGSKGEGDIWAEISCDFKIYTKYSYVSEENDTNDPDSLTLPTSVKAEITFAKANIHIGEDLVIGILNATRAKKDYAKSYFDDDGDGAPDISDVVLAKTKAPGFTVSYKGFNGGFSANGNVKAETATVIGWLETMKFELAEGATLQAVGFGSVINGDKDFGLAVKGGYKTDELALDAAADLLVKSKDDIGVEVAVKAAYAPVTVDVFYNNKTADLNAKAAFEMDDYKAWVDGRKLLKDGRSLEAGASGTFDAITASLSAKYTFDVKTLEVTPKVTYTADMFEVYGKVTLGLDLDASEKLTALKPELGVSSKALIDNATVSLKWTGSNFVKNAAGDLTALGKVTAQVKIAF